MDWQEWHKSYDDPESALSRRLRVVQGEIEAALDRLPARSWRVLSLCAGDGRDLLGVLRSHPRRHDVSGLLVELDPVLAEAGRAAYAGAGITGIEVRTADAGDAGQYDGVRVDLLLACGVLGNVADEGVLRLMARLPELCEPGATVIWTRHRRPPDLTPRIRAALAEHGFDELAFQPLEGSWGCVGTVSWRGTDPPPLGESRLFDFVPDEGQAWQRPR